MENENQSKGKWIGITVLILVVAAFLLYYSRSVLQPTATSQSAEQNDGSTDSVSSIEKDLNATNITNLDSELTDIDKTLAK